LLGSRSSLCACAVRDRSRSSRGGRRKTGTVPREGRQYSTLDILHLISRLLVVSSYLLWRMAPRFYSAGPLDHQPGTNMRIARRRVDGAWDFEDPESPFEPQGIADPSPHPLSASLSQRSTIRSNKTESNTECDHRRDTDNSGVSRLEPPPPAYHSEFHSDEGYTSASRKG
jgi:hypothetical protein